MYESSSVSVIDKRTTFHTRAPRGRRAFAAQWALAAIMLSGTTLVAAAANALPDQPPFDTSGMTTLLSVDAVGVQIYECRTDQAGRLAWAFREPLAILTSSGQTVGRHYAGPSWELNDGGAVTGKVVHQKPGAMERDIALLQLDVSGRKGAGLLSKVVSVQRIDTHGGAFSGPCEKGGALHAEPYSARYVFWGKETQ